MCHQSVGLVAREIESRGIRTVLVGHFPHIAERIRPPRMYIVDAPLGETFSSAYDYHMHEVIVHEALEFARTGGSELIYYPPYVWKDYTGLVLPEGVEDPQPIIIKNPRAL
ncbi:hypothetical protein ACX3VT_08290 [Aerococcus sanguinicola]|uniref:hypothetical protein n=2 Tax=unclassified Aerococcus TaxID=2618060 RepID=UPI0011781F3A|nr:MULTISPECIES: hypothetical protein [unclassified Aerococcus]MDK6855855.1 hypothetical protein [Aerococcus sp. UMB7533]